MHPLAKIFFTGMFISFLGSLPLGTLNVAAMQIGITDGYIAAILFSLGSLLFGETKTLSRRGARVLLATRSIYN